MIRLCGQGGRFNRSSGPWLMDLCGFVIEASSDSNGTETRRSGRKSLYLNRLAAA